MSVKELDVSQALCRLTDPEIFFVEDERSQAVQQAKEVCRKCPIIEDCLDTAISGNIRFGVWGGATPEERSTFKRQPRQKLIHLYITMGQEIDDENTKGYK
jgi:WhiB family redox-sensing transcriptional regulator